MKYISVITLIFLTFYNTTTFAKNRHSKPQVRHFYNFVEVDFVRSALQDDHSFGLIDNTETTGDGFGFKSWYGDQESLFWILEIQRVDFSEEQPQTVAQPISIDEYQNIRIGLGDIVKKNDSLTSYGAASYRKISLEHSDGQKESSSGYDIEMGFRGQIARIGEWLLAATYEDIIDSQVVLKGELSYTMTKNISLLGHYAHSDSLITKTIGIRYNF